MYVLFTCVTHSSSIHFFLPEVLVGEDNPAFEGVFEFCSISAGGSIGTLHRKPRYVLTSNLFLS
jgi:hypothetical protein